MLATAEYTLAEYLDSGPATEILTFDSSNDASDAAWTLRERVPLGWTIEASYNRVFIRKEKTT